MASPFDDTFLFTYYISKAKKVYFQKIITKSEEKDKEEEKIRKSITKRKQSKKGM